MTHSIDTIRASLDALQARSVDLDAKLADAQARRSHNAQNAVLGVAPALKAYCMAISDETVAAALVADARRLEQEITADLASAESKAQADAKRVADEAYAAAFKTRLMAVVNACGIAVPADREAFIDGARRGYEWLAKVYRTQELDRKHDLCLWQEEARMAGHGSVKPDELIAAAYVSGDVLVEDGGKPWNRYLGISLYSGHVANPVPLDAPVQHRVSVRVKASHDEPFVLLLGQDDGRVSQHAIA